MLKRLAIELEEDLFKFVTEFSSASFKDNLHMLLLAQKNAYTMANHTHKRGSINTRFCGVGPCRYDFGDWLEDDR